MDAVEPMSIRLMDASGSIVLDSVATEYEDSFCLETFGDLTTAAIETAPAGSKHFLIARVQTWDPKQPDKSFYSYYHAHHLNKILFQTQVWLEKKLIHRLHVLNPLTNTDIIGNVLYFMVTRRTTVTADGRESHSYYTRRPTVEIQASSSLLQAAPPGSSGPTVQIAPPSPTVSQLPRLFLDPVTLNQVLHNHGGAGGEENFGGGGSDALTDDTHNNNGRPPLSPLPGLTDSEATEVAKRGWTITESVSAEGAEDVPSPKQLSPPLPAAAVTARFSPLRKNSFIDVINRAFSPTPQGDKGQSSDMVDLEKQQQQQQPQSTTTAASRPHSSPEVTQTAPVDDTGVSSGRSGLNITGSNGSQQSASKLRANQLKVSTGFVGITVQPPPLSAGLVESNYFRPLHTPSPNNNNGSGGGRRSLIPPSQQPPTSPRALSRRVVPVGTITQHGQSLSLDARLPDQKRAHRRALSYMNTVNATAGPVSPSLDVWTRNLRQEQLESARIVEEEAGRKGSALKKQFTFDATDTQSTANLLLNPNSNSQTNNNNNLLQPVVQTQPATVTAFYDAFLIATDNDFLETSRIRLLFKENAVADTDAQLFEMPPYTGAQQSGGHNGGDGGGGQGELQLPCDVCFPTEAQLRHPNVCVRMFHQTKCYALLLMIMMAVIAAIYVPMLSRYN